MHMVTPVNAVDLATSETDGECQGARRRSFGLSDATLDREGEHG